MPSRKLFWILALSLGCAGTPPKPTPKAPPKPKVALDPASQRFTQRYSIAFAQRAAASEDQQVAYVDVTADRLLTIDGYGRPVEVVDDKIRVALDVTDEDPLWQPYNVSVHRAADGEARAQEGSAAQRDFVEHYWSMLHALVPLGVSPAQLTQGATWRSKHVYRVRYQGVSVPLHLAFSNRTGARRLRAGQGASVVEVQGKVHGETQPVHGRRVTSSGTAQGVRVLGPVEGEHSGALRMQFVLRDGKTGDVRHVLEQDVGYAVVHFGSITAQQLAARAGYDAEYALACKNESLTIRSGRRAGSLSAGEIASVVEEHAAEAQGCYEKALFGWPTLRGKIGVSLLVERDGSVAEAAVTQDRVGHQALACCLVHAVKTWRFPTPAQGSFAIVTHAFAFDNSGRD